MQKLLARAILFAALCLVAASASAQVGLTGGARLSAIYDVILQARADQAQLDLEQACPPAPRPACLALSSAALWWKIQIDPNDRSHDAELERTARSAIVEADAWTKREPSRAEAWFYLAGAYGPLVQLKVLRGERVSAARSATTIKAALERALALDATMQDAWFGVGLYHYLAGVAPTAAKFLRWLLLMPGGDRVEGLREMERARSGAVLLLGEADYQMHWLYLWYERQPERALALLRGLDARYPSNPVFLQRIAEIQRDSLRDAEASRATWQALVTRADNRQVEFAATAAVRARVGLAEALLSLSQPRDAVDLLEPLATRRPTAPYGASARIHVALARAYQQLGDRDRAQRAFDAAMSSAPADDPDDIRRRARAEAARLRAQRE